MPDRTPADEPVEEAFESVDFAAFTPFDRYKFMTASVVPRPIALVTTLSDTGQVNAAPFSQFIILSSTPPILGIVCGRYPDGPKDTHANILRSGEFVINTVSEPMAEITQLCAIPFASEESETDVFGIRTLPSRVVAPPRLAMTQLAFECRLLRTERYGSTATLVSGEVVSIEARRGLTERHRVDHRILAPLGRISGRRYCRTQDVVEMGSELDDPYRARFREGMSDAPSKFSK